LPNSFMPALKAPGLKALTVALSVGDNDVDGADLVKYPQLEQLSVKDSGYFKGIGALNQLPRLQALNLNETDFYENTGALFDLQHVKTINCYECKFQINSRNPFANNKLEHLTLNQVSIRIGNGDWLHEFDKVMPYFAGLTALRSFTMQDNTLQSLDFMKNWKQIETLHLENNAISDVVPLSKLPNLKKLYILGNQVQNESVLDQGVLIY